MRSPARCTTSAGCICSSSPGGSMYWRVRYSLEGKEKLTQLGVYRKKSSESVTMRLSEARERRDATTGHAELGMDPASHRQAESARLKLETEQARAAAREAREARRAEIAAKKVATGDASARSAWSAEEWLESYRPWLVDKACTSGSPVASRSRLSSHRLSPYPLNRNGRRPLSDAPRFAEGWQSRDGAPCPPTFGGHFPVCSSA